MQKIFFVCFTLLIVVNCVTPRWLPTRSDDNRLDQLRELIKDILESEIQKVNYENNNRYKYKYKRDVSNEMENLQMADKTAAKALNG